MIELDKTTLCLNPYPHMISDQVLDPGLFAALQHEFPTDEIFAANRKRGFAAGRASRINLGRGDKLFAEFMESSPAWRGFFSEINSRAFVERIVQLFGDTIASHGGKVDPNRWEFREQIASPSRTLSSRILTRLGITAALDHLRAALDGTSLCIDFDMAWACNGYATEVHTDNRNKLAAMLVYFGETGGSGGDFQVVKLKRHKPLDDCPRYPRDDELEVVATLRPQPNRGAVFLNCNNAYHTVTSLVDSDRPRKFLYVSVGSRYSAPIW